MLKYFVIPYIALGCFLSMIGGIEYICEGSEMFPSYYGNPVIFKEKSLGSSMTYFYSVFGLLTNTLIWSILITLLRMVMLNIIRKLGNGRVIKGVYVGVVIGLILFATLNILINHFLMGQGFGEYANDWHFDIESDAEKWGMDCRCKWFIY